MFLCVLGAECVINQPIQDAQRREAPGGFPEQVPPPPNSPHKEYGVPHQQHQHQQQQQQQQGAGYNGQQNYGPPQQNNQGPPKIQYGAPASSSSGSLANFVQNHNPDVKSGGINLPENSYGPPDHSHGGSAGGINLPEESYGPPNHNNAGAGGIITLPDNSYGPPDHSHNHGEGSLSNANIVVEQSVDFGPPESSYGPPPSGSAHLESHHENHENSHSESHGHAGGIQSVQSIGVELQLPQVASGSHFRSYATNGGSASNFATSGGDSYSTPPLDSYAPGKYNPSFLNKRPAQPQAQQLPQQPPKLFLPQRPNLLPPQPQYIPPIPIKMLRPRSQAHSHQSIGGHSQHIQHGPSQPQQQIRQQPRYPVAYRQPVPQGLLESIGQQVQALDSGNQIQQSVATYLPPATSDLPFNNQGPQQFHAQQQNQGSSSSGYATQSQSQSQSHQQSSHQQQSSSGAYAYQNEVRNYPTHDCGKGPQFNQVQVPHKEYGPPQDTVNLRHTNVISEALEIPSHNSADFNSASSYGPPASGPALLDNVGYESQVRSNSGASTSETQIIESSGSESHSSSSHQQSEQLPGLNTGLSGLDFISAQKSQSLQIPVQGALGSYQLQFQSSGGNSNDGPNHQQILSDGLLNSILSAIEQPNQQIPQVTEDQHTDHSEVQVFLKSPEGQDVIADKVPE
ncbi:unnamed protein product, partial [Diamesa tonsa]